MFDDLKYVCLSSRVLNGSGSVKIPREYHDSRSMVAGLPLDREQYLAEVGDSLLTGEHFSGSPKSQNSVKIAVFSPAQRHIIG